MPSGVVASVATPNGLPIRRVRDVEKKRDDDAEKKLVAGHPPPVAAV